MRSSVFTGWLSILQTFSSAYGPRCLPVRRANHGPVANLASLQDAGSRPTQPRRLRGPLAPKMPGVPGHAGMPTPPDMNNDIKHMVLCKSTARQEEAYSRKGAPFQVHPAIQGRDRSEGLYLWKFGTLRFLHTPREARDPSHAMPERALLSKA
ncbi:hypothetical protein Landi51_05825 [Colletotrichum acutatum]